MSKWYQFVSNAEVRQTSGQPRLSKHDVYVRISWLDDNADEFFLPYLFHCHTYPRPNHCSVQKVDARGSSKWNLCHAQSSIEGLSGTVKVDRHGRRSAFNLDLITLATDGFEKVDLFLRNLIIWFHELYRLSQDLL